ncbi:MAG: ATP-binding protein [Acidobacteriota bacterium]
MSVQRILASKLLATAASMPVVAVTGPRQSGKTTLCRDVFRDKPYVTLEAIDLRSFASEDPRGFLRQYVDGAIIDEVQRVPELLSYIQGDVDARPEPGRFILTGSQHFGLTEGLSQSLAGRVGVLYLLPPSLDELALFGDLPEDPWEVVVKGSYPRIFDQELEAHAWLADYATTYLQRDVRQVLNVTDLEAFTGFLELAAGRTACEVNLSALGADAGVTHPTARSWLSVLETSFICHRVRAWHKNARKQVVKAPKLHFIDSGLACYLLGIADADQLRRHPLRGALFESWAVAEVLKWRYHRGLSKRLFHYREARGAEIDLLVEAADRLTALEVKSGATVAADYFRHLELLRGRVETSNPHLELDARVLFGGDRGQRRSDATVIPWRDIQEHAW